MKEDFGFSLKEVRGQVDSEQIGFRLSGDKAKPVHFAIGFFRCVLGEYASSDLLGRLVYVVNAKGQVQKGCDIEGLMQDLASDGLIEAGITREKVQPLRGVMQALLSADSAVFGSKGSDVSYSAASVSFVTAKARYEEVGEIGAGIIKEACPELIDSVAQLLKSTDDEISLLFSPVDSDAVPANEDCGALPKWVSRAKKQPSWIAYKESIRKSGLILKENIKSLPKLLAIRTVVHFAIFHLVRYLSRQEAFHDKNVLGAIPFVATYSKNRQSSVVAASRNSFLQIGQSMARFYAAMYVAKFKEYGLSYEKLLTLSKAPIYDAEKKTVTKADNRKAELNTETWKTAKSIAQEECDDSKALLRLGESIDDMVQTASEASPLKYIRGLARKAGILYPESTRVKPYFRFTQDVTSMLVLSTARKGEIMDGDEFLTGLRENFDVVTGALEDDFDFCRQHLRTMCADWDELSKNGESFVEQICDMGYGRVLADGIFRVSIGE